MVINHPIAGCFFQMKCEQARPLAPLPFGSFLATTTWSATAVSCRPDTPAPTGQQRLLLFPIKASIAFLPALPRMLCDRKSGHLSHLVGGHVRNCPFSASVIALRGFGHWFNLFSSTIRTCKSLRSCFSLSFTTRGVSAPGSIRWFANYS